MFKGMRQIYRCRGNLLHEAAALYEVDSDALALEVKQEIAAKDKAQAAKKQPAKATAAKSKKAA
jgi:ParB family transcriptional regulator, chromosome partitioning protein